jgi:hypothetical protein
MVLAVALLAIASPARADHVADIVGVDRDICRMGGIATGIGVDLLTRDFDRVIRNGLTRNYVCRFTDVPRYVSAEESYRHQEWYAPAETMTLTVGCWRPEFEGREEGAGRFTLNPDATARLVCRFIDDSGVDCTLTGTPGADILQRTPADDIICGLGGDYLSGSTGIDSLSGGPAVDTCDGGPDIDAGAGCEALTGIP